MRLRELQTVKLFGLFNHSVPLNLEDRITIIHGPNGYGKTAILRLIAGLFQGRFGVLRTLPFTSLRFIFDDDRVLTVDKSPINAPDGEADSLIRLTMPPHDFSLTPIEADSRSFPLSAIDDIIPELTRVSAAEWLYRPTNEFLTLDDVFAQFGDRLPGRLSDARRLPKWLLGLSNDFPVHYVQAQRLQSIQRSVRPSHERGISTVAAVTAYAAELAGKIQATLAHYAELSQSLDRSFPNRLITQPTHTASSKEDITRTLAALEDKRTRLTQAGLLDKEEHQSIPIGEQINDTQLGVLTVFARDAQQKLAVFDELFARIDIFQTLINRRFTYKTMAISKQNGFIFTTRDGQPLAATSLSTGEQHEIVVLYELLFRVRADSLVLIDEPEMSLHIAWQEQFLSDLQQITTLSRFDVLIATHSPQIISNRWDLTVALQGPE